ncbi:MAG: hypothetical protein VX453_04295 [Acidobacteriota bacterium]|nr:hypothetical protein [Acidobacteriota bacterium]
MIDVSLRATGAECEVLDERVYCGRRGQLGLRLKSLACLLHLSVACSGQGPVAVPSVEIDPVQVVSGSPVQVTLTFSVLPTAGFDEDHLVFLHFLNSDGELMWTVDHYPPRPTSQWQPGDTIQYTKTILMPLCPYFGEAGVLVGLYSRDDGARLMLAGDEAGQRAYRVGRVRLLPPIRNTRFSYRSGWHPLESDSICMQWRWSEQASALVFDNPRQDARLYLALEHREVDDEKPRSLTVSVGDGIAARVEITNGYVVQEIPLTRSLLGDTDEVAVGLAVDRPFVPPALPGEENTDTRMLGVRVMGAYLLVG